MSNGPATEVVRIDGRRVEYRLTRPPAPTGRLALILHGAHMSARCHFAEDAYLDAGCSVLVVSRPGYGRTEIAAGPAAAEFVSCVAGLIRELGFEAPVVAVGVSIGARSALTLASQLPDLLDRVVLISPVSFAPWPSPQARKLARVVFRPTTQALTWGLVHTMLRRDPVRTLPKLITSLSTLPGEEAVRRLGTDTAAMIEFLLSCRSAAGYLPDLEAPTDVTTDVRQPVLIMATRLDAAVEFADHPLRLANALADARLLDAKSPSHLLWLGDWATEAAEEIGGFLSA